MPTQRIVCSALLHRETHKIVLGARHFDPIMRQQIVSLGGEWRHAIQGFIDQDGVFHTRKEAMVIARAAGQIIRRVGGDAEKLFSENLY